MDEQKDAKQQRHGNRSGTTKLKAYEEMLVKSILGTSRPNEPLQAVVENQLDQTALQETNNSVLERNRALLQYVATIANSNSVSDQFNYEFVESLVKGGADINIADQCGQSIFHEVARSWDCDVAKFLLEIGCDINKQDCYGRSPLHVAAAVDYVEMTEFLLKKKANIDARTIGENQAPVHFAAKNGAAKSLQILLGFNADINSLDSKQRTPLQLAAEYTRGKTAEILLEEGAASCLIDSSGNTALSVLIDRLPNLALEALNQLHATDVITMKEFYFIQFLEQFQPQEEKKPVSVGTPVRTAMPAGMKTPAKEKTPDEETPSQTKTAARSPLEMAVITRKFEVVTHPVMQRLIHNKWVQYGRLSTVVDLLFHIVYGVLWTTGCMSTPETGKEIYEPFDARIWLKVIGLILGAMTVYDIVVQINTTLKARKSQKEWVDWRIAQLEDDKQHCHPRWPQEEKYIKIEIKRMKSLPLLNSFGAWFYLDWIVLILIILTTATSVVYYYVDNSATRYVYTRTISIVNLLVWLRLLKCVRPFHGIGTLVIILGETITDFVNWAFLYLLLLIPFTASFWINFGEVSIHPVKEYDDGNRLLYTVFRMAVGDDFNLDGIVEADPVMARILVVLYVTAMTIVTLNLLIALLTDTFSRVYSNAVANTIMQRAIKVIDAKNSLTKSRRRKYEEYMRTTCSPEVLDMDVKERVSASDKQVAQNEVQNNLIYMNELLVNRFGRVYGKSKPSDFDLLLQDIKSLLILQDEISNELLMIQELLTKYSGNKVKFSLQKSRNRYNEVDKNESADGHGKRKGKRRSKRSAEPDKEESKSIFSTLQEKAVLLFQKITGDSEKASLTTKRGRRAGRRRERSEDSEDLRRERRKRRQKRLRSAEGDENTSSVRQSRGRRHPNRSEKGEGGKENATELAIVRYEPRPRRNEKNPNETIPDEESDIDDVV